MDISAPQYNSASESGWTHYLDQSSVSGNYFQMSGGGVVEDNEEDLSMVSDASSGPPIYHQDDYECCYENWYPNHSSSQHTNNNSKEKKMMMKKASSYLDDDTASSPLFSCSNKKDNFPGNGVVENALEFSQGFSATRMKVKPKIKNHFSFFERSLAGKQPSGEPGRSQAKGKAKKWPTLLSDTKCQPSSQVLWDGKYCKGEAWR